MKTLLLKRSQATPQELAAVLWSFVYFFSLLAGYYVLRPILRGLAIEREVDHPVAHPGADDGEQRALEGGIWSGLTDVLNSRYLLGICLFLFSYALLSTFLYFLSVELLPRSITDPAERTQLLAQIDLAVNLLALLLQVLAFKGLITRLGTRVTLTLLPVVSVVGFAMLALYPLVGVVVVFGVLRRAGEYALSKPARETLFNVLPPAQKYKAKNVIDTLVHRTGDTASGWVFAGLRGLGLSGVQISWLSVPIAAGWVAIALSLGRRAEAMQAEVEKASPTIAS